MSWNFFIVLCYCVFQSADNNEQLINAIKEKENTLSVMQVKIKAMESTILDLQEKINEKDQIIEAKNKATILMSDSLSKKGLIISLPTYYLIKFSLVCLLLKK